MVDAKQEFEKLLNENKNKFKKQNIEQHVNIMLDKTKNGKTCYYRGLNECRRYPVKTTVEGNCLCGEHK